mmetsp:Transcript_103538/g.231243  ORF Transcript_103538/g.231243 Transcript_103538/m.231243 type:complete len:93 (+) Transcript_103538:290-568(+)
MVDGPVKETSFFLGARRWRKKWKRLRDGWILDPFTAIRLYLLPPFGARAGLKKKKERNGCNLTPFDRQLISFIIFLILFLLPVNLLSRGAHG